MNPTQPLQTGIPKYIFRGEIYMVDLGLASTDGASVHGGKRPCVVISNDVGNRYSPIVNCCLLSSKVMKKQYPTHFTLQPNPLNKLRQPSVLMAEQLRTVGKEKLLFKIGKLTPEELTSLTGALRIAMDI